MNQSDEHRGFKPRPSVLLVGGDDVHRRLDLMRALSGEFDVAAAGSAAHMSKKFAEAGFDFHYYPLKRGKTPLADLRSLIALIQLFRRWRPEIVHAFASKPAVWARIAARWANVPVVIGTLPGLGSLYSSNSYRVRIFRLLYQELQKRACQMSNMTVLQNERDAEDIISLGVARSENSTIIAGSGVRTDLFDPSCVRYDEVMRFREEIRVDPATIVICMICRMIRTKGVLDLLAAAEILQRRNGRIQLVLVGPDDRDSVDRLADEELDQVRERAVWLGERRDVRTILAASDIFALPSYYREGIPRVLLEAASMGMPLVATRIAGSKEVVTDGVNGFLIPPRDPARLAEAIGVLVDQPQLRSRFGAASREVALARFDVSRVASSTARLYWRLLNGHSRSSLPRRPIRIRSESGRGRMSSSRNPVRSR